MQLANKREEERVQVLENITLGRKNKGIIIEKLKQPVGATRELRNDSPLEKE